MNRTQRFILEHRFEDVRKLAFSSKAKDVDLSYALSQIAGRQNIKSKIPSWYELNDIIYPKHLSLEQCSSEATAKYKGELFKGHSLVDLTGGFGVDCAFLSLRFESVVYVEKQQELYEIASKNFQTLGLNHIQSIHSEAIDYLLQMSKADYIYIDPARRTDAGRKVVTLQDCEPNVLEIKDKLLTKANCVIIKMSPMLDISSALQDLPETRAIHIISVNGECKELIYILNTTENSREKEPEIHCVNIQKSKTQIFTFRKSQEETAISYAQQPEQYIYEPNASCMKAGAYKSISLKYGLKKLHRDSHLYTENKLIEDFPGRIFELISAFSFNKNEMKFHMKDLKQANLSIRNFPCRIDELRKKLNLKDGGDIYLFATILSDKRKVLLKCKQITNTF